MLIHNHVVGADLAVIVWTLAALTLVAAGALILARWRAHGRNSALTPALRAVVFVAVVTIIWVFPGMLAALVALCALSVHWTLRHRRPSH